jgi:chitinase
MLLANNQAIRFTPATGIVTANLAPTVSITAPTNGTVLTAPASITVTATASDGDGAITGVEFLRNGASLGVDTTSPYSASLNSLPAGTYTVAAIATDNAGAKATNTVSLIVNDPRPAAVTILSPSIAGATLTFSFLTQAGQSYAVEFASVLNPNNWLVLTNLTGNGSNAAITDTATNHAQRFYRVRAE